MLRNALQGDVCEKVSGLSGPCSETLMKQRRAAAYFKNNPDEVLNENYNTFTGTPLGGPIDYNMPGYEDAPGTDFRSADIDLCKMKQEMEFGGGEEEKKIYNENEIGGIASNLVNMAKDKYSDNQLNYTLQKEEFLDKLNPFGWLKNIKWIIALIIVVVIIILVMSYM